MYNDILDDIEKDISSDWKDIKRDIDYKKRKECYNEFFKLADDLIELNKKRRKRFENLSKSFGLVNFLREYCTIKLDIGRISGKTEYILRNIKQNDLLVVNNTRLKEYIKKLERIKGIKIVTVREVNDKYLYDNYFDTIWIDDWSFSRNVDDKLYKEYGCDEKQTFIFLG